MIPQWTVTIERGLKDAIVVHVSDYHLTNVLRKIADLDFGDHVTGVTVRPRPPLQLGYQCNSPLGQAPNIQA